MSRSRPFRRHRALAGAAILRRSVAAHRRGRGDPPMAFRARPFPGPDRRLRAATRAAGAALQGVLRAVQPAAPLLAVVALLLGLAGLDLRRLLGPALRAASGRSRPSH